MDEELIHVPVIATCRTEGCAANGVPCALNKPSGEGSHTIVCAQCSAEVTDIVEVND
jgi:hypothetical protein